MSDKSFFYLTLRIYSVVLPFGVISCLLYNKRMKTNRPVDVKSIFLCAVQAADPYTSVASHAQTIRSKVECHQAQRVLVTGFGKAACLMAKAVEEQLSDLIDAGVVITKYGHCRKYEFKKIKVFEAGHPLPDKNGLEGTEEIINLLQNADEKTLVVCLISGGGSALLVAPHEGISLDEKQQITEMLLMAGADINELNTVRKHISAVKGGRLAELAYPARIISLILSDVIGDGLDVIASGPTAPDKTTFSEANRVLEKYKLLDRIPESIRRVIDDGIGGRIPDTPKEGNPLFSVVENIIIGSNRVALNAAKQKAEEIGFEAEIISSELQGEAREVGKWLAEKAKDIKVSMEQGGKASRCIISGGETTVTVKGKGLGGRNMELALSFALEIEGIDGITFLSAGTDGTDGPTDAAGAIVDGKTVETARTAGLAPEVYLNNNDSYNFFRKIDGLLITGPTGTNVMDVQIIIVAG
jgi:hydroxypyruvate reductase/glycerate 2-kinase